MAPIEGEQFACARLNVRCSIEFFFLWIKISQMALEINVNFCKALGATDLTLSIQNQNAKLGIYCLLTN